MKNLYIFVFRVLIMSCAVVLHGPAYADKSQENHPLHAIEKGQEIYRKHCEECHGAEGRGNGPRAAMLAPRPGNLVSAATSAKTDEDLLATIAQGVPRTAMEGWNGRLSEDELRHVLAYIRSLVHFQSPASSLSPP